MGRQISNCQVNVSNRQIPKLDRFLTNDVKKTNLHKWKENYFHSQSLDPDSLRL